jgi:hypothetical protein
METPNRASYKPHRDAKGFGPEIYLDVTNYEYCIDGTTRSFAQSVIYLKTQYQISNKEAVARCRRLMQLDISVSGW